MKATLPGGTVIEGTAEEIRKVIAMPTERPPAAEPAPAPTSHQLPWPPRWGHSPNCPNPRGGPWFSVIPCCNGSAGYAVTTTASTADFDPPGSEYTVGDALGFRRGDA